jgi:hypothetical protein
MLSRGVTRFAPTMLPVSARMAHTDKHFPDLGYYRRPVVAAAPADFIDAQLEEKELRRAHYYTLNAALTSGAVWGAANFVAKAVNLLNPTAEVMAMATVELEVENMAVGKQSFFYKLFIEKSFNLYQPIIFYRGTHYSYKIV